MTVLCEARSGTSPDRQQNLTTNGASASTPRRPPHDKRRTKRPSLWGYKRGCRCTECNAENNAAMRRYRSAS